MKRKKVGRKRKRRPQQGDGIRDFFRGLTSGYKTVSKVGEMSKQYEEANKRNTKLPPPLPKKPKHLRAPKINVIEEKKEPVAEKAANFVDTVKKYKPISTIDSILKDLGIRDKVRDKLNSHALGKHLVNSADVAIQQGFGHRAHHHHYLIHEVRPKILY